MSWKPNFQQTVRQIGIPSVENNQAQESPEYKLLKDKLKPIFLEAIDIFHNKIIDERIYLTKVNTKINNTLLKCVDY